MSLKSAGNIDSMLANINTVGAATTDSKNASEMNYYSLGRKTAGPHFMKAKPINVTPAGRGRPYCRHKEFLKMP